MLRTEHVSLKGSDVRLHPPSEVLVRRYCRQGLVTDVHEDFVAIDPDNLALYDVTFIKDGDRRVVVRDQPPLFIDYVAWLDRLFCCQLALPPNKINRPLM